MVSISMYGKESDMYQVIIIVKSNSSFIKYFQDAVKENFIC